MKPFYDTKPYSDKSSNLQHSRSSRVSDDVKLLPLLPGVGICSLYFTISRKCRAQSWVTITWNIQTISSAQLDSAPPGSTTERGSNIYFITQNNIFHGGGGNIKIERKHPHKKTWHRKSLKTLSPGESLSCLRSHRPAWRGWISPQHSTLITALT